LADSVTAARPRAFSLAVVRSIPAWAWLAGLVVCSIAFRYALGRRNVAPWIMVDELVYSELAKSFAATGHFLWRDQPAGSYGFVYPVVLSPAYRDRWRGYRFVPRPSEHEYLAMLRLLVHHRRPFVARVGRSGDVELVVLPKSD